VLDIADDLVAFFVAAVDVQPAWALGDVLADEQHPDGQHRA